MFFCSFAIHSNCQDLGPITLYRKNIYYIFNYKYDTIPEGKFKRGVYLNFFTIRNYTVTKTGYFGQNIKPYLMSNEASSKYIKRFRNDKIIGEFTQDLTFCLIAAGFINQVRVDNWRNEHYSNVRGFTNGTKAFYYAAVTAFLSSIVFNVLADMNFYKSVSAYNKKYTVGFNNDGKSATLNLAIKF